MTVSWDITQWGPLKVNRRWLTYSSMLKMDSTCFYENSFDFQRITRHYNAEDRTIHTASGFQLTPCFSFPIINNIVMCLRGVTNNNGIWIKSLDLLLTSLQSLIITITHNKWLPRASSMLTKQRLTSNLRLTSFSKSKSKLCYDWRSVGQSILE
jgi:hypothetical protein